MTQAEATHPHRALLVTDHAIVLAELDLGADDPTLPSLLTRRGRLLMILEQNGEAETALRKSIDLFERTPGATDEQRREPHDALAALVARGS